jgi:pimeloyl-ACP methyl ester carboxylesterase
MHNTPGSTLSWQTNPVLHSSASRRCQDGVSYTSEGHGPPVIMVHGIGASLFDWASLSPTLAQNGYSAYALDLLGHGDSYKPPSPGDYHIHAVYEHLCAWLDSLNLQEPVTLVGHSLGGYLSIYHALQRPEQVRRLVLINPLFSLSQLSPALRWASRNPRLGERATRVVPAWLIHTILGWDPDTGRNFSPQIRRQIVIDYKRASPHFVYITQDVPDLAPRASQIEPATLLLWGERDMTLSPRSFPVLEKIIPCVQAKSIPGSGHQPHIGRPELVNRWILDFLNSAGPC